MASTSTGYFDDAKADMQVSTRFDIQCDRCLRKIFLGSEEQMQTLADAVNAMLCADSGQLATADDAAYLKAHTLGVRFLDDEGQETTPITGKCDLHPDQRAADCCTSKVDHVCNQCLRRAT